MIKFFRKIRQNLLLEGKSGKYLKYAIGEIILVVMGILIALSINNWNERRNQEQTLKNIYAMIADDLEQDLKKIEFVIQIKKKSEPIFTKVLNNKMTIEDYEENPAVAKIILGLNDLPLNTRGYNLLTSYRDTPKTYEDKLSAWIIEFYQVQSKTFAVDDEIRMNDVENNITDWKNNHSWYSNFITKDDNTHFIEYALNDQDYKNRVANYYLLNYTIYTPLLEDYKKGATQLINEIKAKIN